MNDGIVVTALDARANFGKLLRRVEEEGRSLVIEKRGSPRAVLLSIRDYVRLALPEPEVLRVIGKESKRKGTNKLSATQIDRIVTAARRSPVWGCRLHCGETIENSVAESRLCGIKRARKPRDRPAMEDR
jgi:prevent-host-death family protein